MAAILQGLAPAGVEDPLVALVRLDPAALAERLPTLLEDRPGLALNALLWRAGGSVPSGLGSARTARRGEQRTAFLDLLGSSGDPRARRARVLVHLTELVRSSRSAVALRCAGLRCAAELELYELTWLLEAALTDGDEQVRFVASQALASLYGRRFATPERWSEFLGEVPRALAPVLAEQLRALEEERRQLYTGSLRGSRRARRHPRGASRPRRPPRGGAPGKAAVIAQDLDLAQAFEALRYAAEREAGRGHLRGASDRGRSRPDHRGRRRRAGRPIQLAKVVADAGRTEHVPVLCCR